MGLFHYYNFLSIFLKLFEYTSISETYSLNHEYAGGGHRAGHHARAMTLAFPNDPVIKNAIRGHPLAHPAQTTGFNKYFTPAGLSVHYR